MKDRPGKIRLSKGKFPAGSLYGHSANKKETPCGDPFMAIRPIIWKGRKQMDQILQTVDLCKYYGKGENEVKAVQHANLEIQKGEFVAIVGKSGSGKSTLLHMMGGLDTPTSGKVLIRGKDIFSYKDDALAVFR